MHKRILMVFEGTLLELTSGCGHDCWFRKKGMYNDCALDTKLTKMCQTNRRYLDLSVWNWVEVTR